ncbi:MAG: DoxX family protein [Acidobacteria bacterium]|nr:DoxX family protein [Acidobacteriota bacterium]
MNFALWIVQALLALLFLYGGGVKLVLTIEEMTALISLPGWFLRFLGVAEVLSAIGLILPGLLRIRPGLTPLAAAGLVIIMVGATTITLLNMGLVPALFPPAVGLLAAFVAYGRWRLTPPPRPTKPIPSDSGSRPPSTRS